MNKRLSEFFAKNRTLVMLVSPAVVIIAVGSLVYWQTVATESADTTTTNSVVLGTDDEDSQAVEPLDETGLDESPEKLPDSFDTELPVYPGATLQTTLDNPDEKAVVAYWTTPDSLDQVAAFYREKLPDTSWTVEGDNLNESDFLSITISQGTREGAVIMAASDTETGIAISLTEKTANQ